MTPEEFFKLYTANIETLCLKTRELILSVAPDDVTEYVQEGHKTVVYTTGRRMGDAVCYIGAFKQHVNLGFMNGTSLPDPENLLVGTGKNLRHVKLRTAEDIAQPAVKNLITAAFALDT